MSVEERTAPSDADLLVAIAEEEAELTSWQSRGYATVVTQKGRRTLQLRGPAFQSWLRLRFRELQGRIAPAAAVKAAVTALGDIAGSADEKPVFLRTAGHDGKVYLDLADDSGRAVEIDADGWRIVSFPPVRFVRSNLTLPLPKPAGEGSLEDLRQLFNLPDDGSFQLLTTWCVAALMPNGPYPLIAVGGEQGAAKSTMTTLLQALVDPSLLPLRALPRSERELYIAAANAHILNYDNVSSIGEWLSDAFCKIATGGGMALRQLFTDDGEIYFQAVKPLVLNGIEDVVTRADLADRAIILSLPAIAQEKRVEAGEFMARFQERRPRIFGVLLDLMAQALAKLPTLQTERLPRMAGFAKIGIAIEQAFGEPGCFMASYDANRAMSSAILAESDPLVAAVRKLALDHQAWRGTATDLVKVLEPRLVPPKRFEPAALSGRLRRLAPVLRSNGIDIEFEREGKGRDRMITIAAMAPKAPSAASAPSTPS